MSVKEDAKQDYAAMAMGFILGVAFTLCVGGALQRFGWVSLFWN